MYQFNILEQVTHGEHICSLLKHCRYQFTIWRTSVLCLGLNLGAVLDCLEWWSSRGVFFFVISLAKDC